MFLPISPSRTDNPYDGMTDKQRAAFDARAISGLSWGRIAFRANIRIPSARGLCQRALRRFRANGWDVLSPLFRAA